MGNILIGDDVVNLDSMESAHRSYVKTRYKNRQWEDVDPPLMTVTISFPRNPEGENYLSFTGSDAELIWSHLTKHSYILQKSTDV